MNEFEEIYNKYQQDVLRFLMHLTSFDAAAAEELTQETFYQAFLSFGKFRGECSLRTWLFQIARNIYTKYIRREIRQLVNKPYFLGNAFTCKALPLDSAKGTQSLWNPIHGYKDFFDRLTLPIYSEAFLYY